METNNPIGFKHCSKEEKVTQENEINIQYQLWKVGDNGMLCNDKKSIEREDVLGFGDEVMELREKALCIVQFKNGRDSIVRDVQPDGKEIVLTPKNPQYPTERIGADEVCLFKVESIIRQYERD